MERVRRQLSEWRRQQIVIAVAFLTAMTSSSAVAGKADVLKVAIECDANRVCRFDVTVQHADAGWDHFANRWEIVTTDGVILATRVLAHPHDEEQPFTRSLDSVKIPVELESVIIRVNDSIHGLGGQEKTVAIPAAK